MTLQGFERTHERGLNLKALHDIVIKSEIAVLLLRKEEKGRREEKGREGKGREGKGREEKRRKGKKRKGKEGEGKETKGERNDS